MRGGWSDNWCRPWGRGGLAFDGLVVHGDGSDETGLASVVAVGVFDPDGAVGVTGCRPFIDGPARDVVGEHVRDRAEVDVACDVQCAVLSLSHVGRASACGWLTGSHRGRCGRALHRSRYRAS
ncbi:MAG: hypothetical protein ACO3VI_12125, partial [Ilumatobacteraceae bacterium]